MKVFQDSISFRMMKTVLWIILINLNIFKFIIRHYFQIWKKNLFPLPIVLNSGWEANYTTIDIGIQIRSVIGQVCVNQYDWGWESVNEQGEVFTMINDGSNQAPRCLSLISILSLGKLNCRSYVCVETTRWGQEN